MINEIPNLNTSSSQPSVPLLNPTPTRSLSLKVSKLTNKLLMKNIDTPEPIPEDSKGNAHVESVVATTDNQINEDEGMLKALRYDQFDNLKKVESSTILSSSSLIQSTSLASISSLTNNDLTLSSRNTSIASEVNNDEHSPPSLQLKIDTISPAAPTSIDIRKGSGAFTFVREELLPPLVTTIRVTSQEPEITFRQPLNASDLQLSPVEPPTIKEQPTYVDPLLLSPSNTASPTKITEPTPPLSAAKISTQLLRERPSNNSLSTNYDLADAMAASILEKVKQENENDSENGDSTNVNMDDWKI